MENASKALIMAGGMLLAILVISLFIYAWTLFSKYQSSGDSLAEIQDTSKFNAQFTSYDRDNVMGYEIISLMNKVVDYNERKSVEALNENDEKYPCIQMTFKFSDENGQNGEINRKKLIYNDQLFLFKKDEYKENEKTLTAAGKIESFRENIGNEITRIKSTLTADEDALTSLAKHIGTIFRKKEDLDALSKEVRLRTELQMIAEFNSCIGEEKIKSVEEIGKLALKRDKSGTIDSGLGDYYKMSCVYYEYMQFKRSEFKCIKLDYDDGNTGRVKNIEFQFVKIR